MASDVEISNMALAHIGDIANISSLTEQSVQAQYCSAYLPIARDTLLEMHTWRFASVRQSLALVGSTISEWTYAYAVPANMLKALAVHAVDAISDYSAPLLTNPLIPSMNLVRSYGAYTPQPFVIEVDANGVDVIYTNQVTATLRYTQRVTNSAKFPPLFVMALSWHLASLLAGSIIKGKEGAAESKRCLVMMQQYLAQAREADTNNSSDPVQHNVAWMVAR